MSQGWAGCRRLHGLSWRLVGRLAAGWAGLAPNRQKYYTLRASHQRAKARCGWAYHCKNSFHVYTSPSRARRLCNPLRSIPYLVMNDKCPSKESATWSGNSLCMFMLIRTRPPTSMLHLPRAHGVSANSHVMPSVFMSSIFTAAKLPSASASMIDQ